MSMTPQSPQARKKALAALMGDGYRHLLGIEQHVYMTIPGGCDDQFYSAASHPQRDDPAECRAENRLPALHAPRRAAMGAGLGHRPCPRIG